MLRRIVAISRLALVAMAWGCQSLEITNPNDPDYNRAVSDPRSVEAVAAGAMRTWFVAYTILDAAGALSTQARTYSASWNNGNMEIYSSVDIAPNDTITSPATWTRLTRGWRNDPVQPARSSVEAFWNGGSWNGGETAGFYSALSSANDALIAIRKGVMRDTTRKMRTQTMATLLQGASLMMIALNYDRGFVDENTDATPGVATAQYANRKQLRDAALAKLQAAIALAKAKQFTTDASWTNGITYTSTEIGQIANTLAAMTLAWYPRDAAETATQVDWAAVATFASNGMSAGTPVDLAMVGDGFKAFGSDIITWCNSPDSCRVSTRVAHLLAPETQRDPYPLGVGNPQPTSLDHRLGDGSFGTEDLVDGFGTVPKTSNAGTDFVWSSQEIFRPDRGFYHQSNIGHIRYDASGVLSTNDIYGGFGRMPAVSATVNDLLWAEALLRVGNPTDFAQAAALINKTRTGRGGLPAAAATDALGSPTDGPCMSTGVLAKDGTTCTLFSKLLYECEIELLGLGAAPFYNQRRLPVLLATSWERVDGPAGTSIFNGPRYIQGLIPGTPREMPVPHTELALKGEPLYTWGGAKPANSTTP